MSLFSDGELELKVLELEDYISYLNEEIDGKEREQFVCRITIYARDVRNLIMHGAYCENDIRFAREALEEAARAVQVSENPRREEEISAYIAEIIREGKN